jgi:hypothetical protein
MHPATLLPVPPTLHLLLLRLHLRLLPAACCLPHSPSTSYTVKAGPKSVNTLANTPRDSTRMKGMGGLWEWHTSLMRFDSSSPASVSTTTCARV